jgi:hypothetical protein
MKLKACIIGCVALAPLVTLLVSAKAQQPRAAASSRTIAYNAARESFVQGTVVAYVENSNVPPIGVHVSVQTASGTVDVHLGPARYLRANHFSLAPGDSVRFVGAIGSSDRGAVFLARIAQKGGQAIAIRSAQGFLLATSAARSMSKDQRAQAQQVSAR